ncbi:MAG: hypothetical protein Q9159_001494 [Coniocarpon cinnabarinum]
MDSDGNSSHPRDDSSSESSKRSIILGGFFKFGGRKRGASKRTSAASNSTSSGPAASIGSADHEAPEKSSDSPGPGEGKDPEQDTDDGARAAFKRRVAFLPLPDPLRNEHYQAQDGRKFPLTSIKSGMRGDIAFVTYTFGNATLSESNSQQPQNDPESPKAESSKTKSPRVESSKAASSGRSKGKGRAADSAGGQPYAKRSEKRLWMRLGHLKIGRSERERIQLAYSKDSDTDESRPRRRRRSHRERHLRND